MNVTAIEMDPQVAAEKLAHYRAVLAGKHSAAAVEAEFRAAEAAFAELAKGTPLVDPVEAIRGCGWRPDGRPVLAIARADQTRVTWRTHNDARRWDGNHYTGNWSPMEWQFTAAKERRDRQRARNLVFQVRGITEEPPKAPKAGTAMVPMVPADAYPARGLDLSKHFVLWEVESWDFAPPVDPMLLRPIGGNLYAVIAQWDLTPIERAIISGTRRDA